MLTRDRVNQTATRWMETFSLLRYVLAAVVQSYSPCLIPSVFLEPPDPSCPPLISDSDSLAATAHSATHSLLLRSFVQLPSGTPSTFETSSLSQAVPR